MSNLQPSLLSRVGAAGLASFFVASIITGALNSGYSPMREAISALAATDAEFAWIMIAGFMACAVGLASIGIALWRAFGGNRPARIAAALVTLGGPFMVVAGLARQDCSERLTSCIDHGEAPNASTHFWVHQFSSLLLFVLMTIALFFLARGLRRDRRMSHFSIPTRVAGTFCALVIASMIVNEMTFIDAYAGLAQRAFLLVLFGWPLVVATATRTELDERPGSSMSNDVTAHRF